MGHQRIQTNPLIAFPVALSFLACAAGACAKGGTNESEEGGDESEEAGDNAESIFFIGPSTTVENIREWSPEACAVLELCNESTLTELDIDAGLIRWAAENIVAHRNGTDGLLGTTDDDPFDSLRELDSIRFVGGHAFKKLLRYSQKTGHACAFPPVSLQILSVSDWHGQLDPVSVPGVGNVGGAAVLSTYFRQARAENPNTLTLTAGDGFGATPPLASFFEEETAVRAMNLMGFDADGLGNHNFDRGVEHLERMAGIANYPYLSSNLENVDENMSCPARPRGSCVAPYALFDVGGVKIAVIGATNPDAPNLVKPGSFGTIAVGSPVPAILRARTEAAAEGAQVFVVIAHVGAFGALGAIGSEPVGPLVDLAHGLAGIDVILGDHTNVPINAKIGDALVVENKSAGLTYARVSLSVDRESGYVTARSAELLTPLADAVVPDPAIAEFLAPYRTQLAEQFDRVIAATSGVFQRGNNAERLAEVPIGNLLTDALRLRYVTQLAFTNGGGIRAPLPSSYLPLNTGLRRTSLGYASGPPYDLVVGDMYAVLPFGNSVVTRTVTGRVLHAMLEHSVSALPSPNGWFGQISGFSFTFDSSRPAGSRVVSVTLHAAEADQPIEANDVAYTLATSDFIAAGGDGYSMLLGGEGTSRDKMADVLLGYVEGLGTLTPTVSARITDLASP